MKQKFKFFAMFLLCLSFTSLYAQESTNVSGGTATGKGGTVNYSIGQVAYSVQVEDEGTVAQGVQQPYEIMVKTGIEYSGIQLGMKAYPNPASDFLILKMDRLDQGAYSYQLYDALGQMLEYKQITGNETRIDMQNLAPAIYYVNIKSDMQTLKNFKIIKN